VGAAATISKALTAGQSLQVINTEWGQFESKFIPMLSTDRDLDAASAHPGRCVDNCS
jgi:hexokinase